MELSQFPKERGDLHWLLLALLILNALKSSVIVKLVLKLKRTFHKRTSKLSLRIGPSSTSNKIKMVHN